VVDVVDIALMVQVMQNIVRSADVHWQDCRASDDKPSRDDFVVGAISALPAQPFQAVPGSRRLKQSN
jgi:hypothetical protein